MPDKARRRSRAIFMLFFFIALLMMAYSIYWHVAANQIRQKVDAWIATQAEAGTTISYDALKTSGFPYRFHVDVNDVDVITSDQQTVHADTLMIVAKPYNPTHIIAYAPGQIEYSDFSGVSYSLPGNALQASLRWSMSGLKRFSIVADDLAIQRDAKPWMTLKLPFFHAAPREGIPADLQFITGFDDMTIATPPEQMEWLGDHAGRLRSAVRIAQGNVLLQQGFSLDRLRQLDAGIATPETEVSWGPLQMRLKSDRLSIDKSNRLEGVFQVRLENIDALEAALRDEGMLNDRNRLILAALKGVMADDAWVPVELKNGRASVASIGFMDLPPLF